MFDEQHKQIVDKINLLIFAPEMTMRSESISESLEKLTKYATIHFRAEEQLLEEFGYHNLALQRDAQGIPH